MHRKFITYVMTTISASGVFLSFYVQYFLGIPPCLECIILRYSYLLLALIYPLSLIKRSILPIIAAVSVIIIAVSIWGVLGYLGILPNPCIESCPIGLSAEIGRNLSALALFGGILSLIASNLLWKKSNS
jgi:disulfide bond formation protein DsbB